MSQPAPASASSSAPAALASSASSSCSIGSHVDEEFQGLFTTGADLLLRAVPLVESESNRFQVSRSSVVKTRAAELASWQEELGRVLELPVDQQAAANPRKIAAERAVATATTWLDTENAYKEGCVSSIENARALATQPQASLQVVHGFGSFCSTLFSLFRLVATESPEQASLREWLLGVDALFTQLAAAVPRMQLSSADQEALLRTGLSTGALQLIPALMRCSPGVPFPSIRMRTDYFLTHHCNLSSMHFINRRPYLRLFEFGMDPTEIAQGGNPLSFIQLARNFVQENQRAEQEDQGEAAEAVTEPLCSLLPAWAAQHRASYGENRRRDLLRAKLMHATIRAWLAHSTMVRALLLDVAPDRLIPPLVDIVSRYLDLEGVPPEPVAAPVDDGAIDAAMS